jgi:hypothetical protein
MLSCIPPRVNSFGVRALLLTLRRPGLAVLLTTYLVATSANQPTANPGRSRQPNSPEISRFVSDALNSGGLQLR